MKEREKLALLAKRNIDFMEDLRERVDNCGLNGDLGEKACTIASNALNIHLFRQGEAFSSALAHGVLPVANADSIKDVVIEEAGRHKMGKAGDAVVAAAISAVNSIVENPSDVALEHIRSVADSYALLSFVHETPDVQKALNKLFVHGEIWLDTTIEAYSVVPGSAPGGRSIGSNGWEPS